VTGVEPRDPGGGQAYPTLTIVGRPSESGPKSVVQTATLHRVRQLFIRHYGIPTCEIDDLVGETMTDYIRAVRRSPGDDRLFIVIAQRRACDFCRRRRRKATFRTAEPLRTAPDHTHLEIEMLERMADRFAETRSRLNRTRLVGLVHGIVEGCSFAEACRLQGIPRGSQERYRLALRQCFKSLR
jgi:DNA-directed RNA polymerase specialized sigma24 family protein